MRVRGTSPAGNSDKNGWLPVNSPGVGLLPISSRGVVSAVRSYPGNGAVPFSGG